MTQPDGLTLDRLFRERLGSIYPLARPEVRLTTPLALRKV